MTEHELGPDPEESSEVEEVIFEEEEGHGASAHTAPSEAPFQAGQILGGRFEVVGDLRATPATQIIRAKDRVRGGADIALEVVQKAVLAGFDDLNARIKTVVPRLKGASHEVLDPLLDFGMLPDGRLYFASQLLTGDSLADKLRRREALLPEQAFAVTQRLLRGLEYGLSIQQVHGGLDAHSIFFEEDGDDLAGNLRLLAFGRMSVIASKEEMPSEGRDLQAIGPLLAQMLVGEPIKGAIHRWWEKRAPKLSKQAAALMATAIDSVDGKGFADLVEFRTALEALPQFRTRQQSSSTVGWISLAFAAGLLGAAGTWYFLNERSDRGEVLAHEPDASVAEVTEEPVEEPAEVSTEVVVVPIVPPLPDPQIARLRDGLDLTNQAVVDLRATTQAYDAMLAEMQAQLDSLNAEDALNALDAEKRAQATAELLANMKVLDMQLISIDGRLGILEAEEEEAEKEGESVVAQAAPSLLPLPESASPALRAAAEDLFSGQVSPFGPIGSRALHHTLTAEGDEGWLVVTVGRDDATPEGADQSWILEEEYLSADGKPLGTRRIQVVQRGGRFEEVDGRIYPLLDLENPWVNLSTEKFQPRQGLIPPASLAVSEGALAAFQKRAEIEPMVALVEVDGNRRSWFVPGLGFVRYEDPLRIRRELVLIEAH